MLDKVYVMCINERPTTIVAREAVEEIRKSGIEVVELVNIDDVIVWLQDRQPVWIEFKNYMKIDNDETESGKE